MSTCFPGYDDLPWVRDGYPVTIEHMLAMTAGPRWQPLTTDCCRCPPSRPAPALPDR